MAGHSRPKDGVASARLCPAIHALPRCTKNVDARDKPGHDESVHIPPKTAAGMPPVDPLKGCPQFRKDLKDPTE
jgi:hypothetical protein